MDIWLVHWSMLWCLISEFGLNMEMIQDWQSREQCGDDETDVFIVMIPCCPSFSTRWSSRARWWWNSWSTNVLIEATGIEREGASMKEWRVQSDLPNSEMCSCNTGIPFNSQSLSLEMGSLKPVYPYTESAGTTTLVHQYWDGWTGVTDTMVTTVDLHTRKVIGVYKNSRKFYLHGLIRL